MPVSVSPVEFIRRQANYMESFVMPLALLGGWFLAHLPRNFGLLVGGAMIVSGILLPALEQEVVRVVLVNRRVAALFAASRAGTRVPAPLTGQRQYTPERLLRGRDVGIPYSMCSLVPPRLAATTTSAIDPLSQVSPAKVYTVIRECARGAQNRLAPERPLLLDRSMPLSAGKS
jgi:hypothetical protein